MEAGSERGFPWLHRVAIGAGDFTCQSASATRPSIPLWCDWDIWRAVTTCRTTRSFNPIVVRLGRTCDYGLGYPCLCFQSHCGAIGTCGIFSRIAWTRPPFNPTVVRLGLPGRVPLLPLLLPFNPTVVRLGRRNCQGSGGGVMTFNPTVVRLGRVRGAEDGGVRQAFNPTVVRLGRAPPVCGGRPCPHFQSHCGAIGTP